MYVKSIKSSLINGVRVDSLEVRFPRIILPEILTHRDFSRNFQSNRAKPISKVIQEDLTYNPEHYGWRKANKGMSPIEDFTIDESYELELNSDWHSAKCKMIDTAKFLGEKGVAKEIVNRLLEPFMQVTGIITSTKWNNFLTLRCDDSAQIEIRELAKEIKKVLESTTPIERDFHLPYVEDTSFLSRERLVELIKQSTARCARVSYFSFDKKETELEKDIELYEKLKNPKPHLSPFEHSVFHPKVLTWLFPEKEWVSIYDLHGNLSKDVIQFRKLIELGLDLYKFNLLQ